MSTVNTTTNNPAESAAGAAPKRKINKRFIVILAVLVIGGGAFGFVKYNHAQHHEETDDAQVEANIAPVIPRVAGYVNEVRVRDNQRVKKGDTLLVLDDRDLRIRLEQAEAALAAAQSSLTFSEGSTSVAQANVVTSQANVATVSAQIEAAKVTVWRATQDYNRYANLIKDHSITQQQYEQGLAAKQSAERQLQILVEQRNAAAQQSAAAARQSTATGSNVGVANATIKQRQAEVENARLTLSYTVVTAPENGFVSKVNVQPGQYLNAGGSLFSVVLDNELWVVANFKETQLSKMQEGQEVEISIDALGGETFKGKVSSFSPATGARFSLLPPDNASGNFVKVVQRLPVRIEFTDRKDSRMQRLRAGMNAVVDVHI
jgi:membrane fusion protein (multidrug efflux system)